MYRTAQTSALILIAQYAQQAQAGAIPEDGIWTGSDHEFYDEVTKIGVKNGKPYSNDTEKKRWLEAAWTIDGKVDDYLETDHIKRVKTIFPEADWDAQFTHIDALYTYKAFIKSVAEFPAFCNETQNAGESLDDACRRELATFFAHVTQETGNRKGEEDTWWRQGLHYLKETIPHDYKSYEWGNDLKWPNVDGVQYYGRGPLQLSWNYNLGQFSNTFYSHSDGYDSKSVLLKNPDAITKSGFLSFSSAMWFYMTPSEPKPSMHDVVTGYWAPNAKDKDANINHAGFGTTINIINGREECNQGAEERMTARGKYYNLWLDFFGLDDEENLGCGEQSTFPEGGAGDTYQFWAKGWKSTGGNSCQLVHYHTQYSVMSRDDYKRCVCDTWGKGEESCTAQ